MAHRAQPIGLWLPGLLALALVLTLTGGSIAAALLRGGGVAALTPADMAAIRFGLMQALLSATISVGFAIPIARALGRRRFPGRRALIGALGAPFILPVIVAVMGLLALFGRSGLLARAFGIELPIFGLAGILIAHVFLNLPLAVRMILNGWAAIPAERFRLAASLGFGPRDVFRLLEWPMLRAILPEVALSICLVCLSSFTVVLILGGGPRASTPEIGIYQAVRMEFDLAHAGSLALVQMALCLGFTLLALAVGRPDALGSGLDRVQERWDAGGFMARLLDAVWLLAVALFLLVPLGLVGFRGLGDLADLSQSVWWAALRSLLVALAAAGVAVTLGLSFGLVAVMGPKVLRPFADRLVMLPLAVSPLVMGTGLYLMLHGHLDPATAALPLTALTNASMILPFMHRILVPGIRRIWASYGPLAESLDLRGLTFVRLVVLPRLRQPLGLATGLAAAASMGDLGVITLFAGRDQATLPMQIYALMGAYRMDQAAAAGLVLSALSLALFWLFDRLGHRDADA